MKTVVYHHVSSVQVIFTAVMIGVISACLILINNRVTEYLQLPMVFQDSGGACVSVKNYRNGDAFTCVDVDVLLRKYRVLKQ